MLLRRMQVEATLFVDPRRDVRYKWRLSIIKWSVILLILIAALLSCSKEEKTLQAVGPQKTGLYKIELSPSYAIKTSTVTVKVKGANPSDLSYQWIVNDIEIEGVTENVFKYPELKKNDRVQVKVFIKGQGELISKPLIISNIIPQIQSAKLIPQNPQKGDELKLEVKTFDGDGDNVTLLYEWFINGESSGETFDVINIDGTLIKRGDKVSVKITPTDGQQEGQSITLYSIVANSPPKVSPDIKARFDGLIYMSEVIAEDPEGDPLTYTLKKRPEGMIINPESGGITWEITPKDEGEHEIIVSVNDGHGGEVLVPFTTKISLVSPQ